MSPRAVVASAVVAVPAVLAALADPVGRGLTLSQAALLAIGAATLALPVAPARAARGPVVWLPVLLMVAFLTSTAAAFVLRREVDVIQAVRDLRDLAIFAAGVFALARWAAAFNVATGRALLAGLGGVLVIELALRDRALYGLLFQEPFGRARYRAGFLGPNEYGAVASIVFAMGVGAWIEHRSAVARAGAAVCLGASVLVLLSTLSRGSAAGAAIAAALVTAVATADVMARGGPRPWRRFGAVAALLVLGAVTAAAASGRLSLLWTALRTRVDQAALGGDVEDRATLMVAALDIATDAPVIGRGLGAFAALNATRGGSGTLSPHNELAKAFAEGGLLAASVLTAWFVALGVTAWRRRREPGGLSVLGGVFAFILAEQFFTYLVRPGLSVIAATLVAGLSAPRAGPPA